MTIPTWHDGRIVNGYYIKCLKNCGTILHSPQPMDIGLCGECKEKDLPFYDQLEVEC